jgi:hypothetical protein
VSPAKPIVRTLIALIAAAALLGSTSCATLFASGPDEVPVVTNPPGAYVYVNAIFIGQSPTVAHLDRDHPGQIQIYLPGFQPVVMMRGKTLNGWFIANLLWFYFVVPVIVDLVTGNWQRYDDIPVMIGLMPAQSAAPPPWYEAPAQPYVPGQPQQPRQPYPPAPQPYPTQPYQPQPPPVAPPPVR